MDLDEIKPLAGTARGVLSVNDESPHLDIREPTVTEPAGGSKVLMLNMRDILRIPKILKEILPSVIPHNTRIQMKNKFGFFRAPY
jgi:hypothetical protein